MNTIVFGTADPATATQISRRVQKGELRKLARSLYTTDLETAPEIIVRNHVWQILDHFYPGAIVSHRSALENKISTQGAVYLTYTSQGRAELPGLTIFLLKGPPAQPEDQRFLTSLRLSSAPRAMLENMQRARTTDKGSKTLPERDIEAMLAKRCAREGRDGLIRFAHETTDLAKRIGMEAESAKFNAIVTAILGSKSEAVLATPEGAAMAAGVAYDQARVKLFTEFAAHLSHTPFARVADTAMASSRAEDHRAFFEAYFSNFIEGTRFKIEEAEEIVFQNKIPSGRTADAHDVLGTYRLASSGVESRRVASSPAEFLSLLLAWHETLMAGRPEARPGEFKDRDVFFGSHEFVKPALVRGTLLKAWDIGQQLEHPFARALFWKVAVVETHPFQDGNGRISRLVMNAQLTAAGLSRIIVPTVYREDYFTAISALTQKDNPGPFVRAMERLQTFTSVLPFGSYEDCKLELEKRNAFLHHSEGKLIWEAGPFHTPMPLPSHGPSGLFDVLADATQGVAAPLPVTPSRGGRAR